jgi:N utilization substance protein B
MQSLYEWDFYNKEVSLQDITERNIKDFGPGLEDLNFTRSLIEGAKKHIVEIDKIIEKAAPEWPIAQIPLIDRNVLRLGLFELLFGDKKEVPPKVAINEAIELAKNFSGKVSGRFVNGVLGTVYKQIEPSAAEACPEGRPDAQ